MAEAEDKALDEAVGRYEGPFLESADLMHSEPVRVTIENVIPPDTEKDSQNKLIRRPMLVIKGAKRKNRMIVSKTNARILKAVHGARASSWVGQQVVIGVRYLREAFGQQNVPTLRIIPPPDVPLPMVVRKHYGQPRPFTPEELKG